MAIKFKGYYPPFIMLSQVESINVQEELEGKASIDI
jgi:hypothetical protein